MMPAVGQRPAHATGVRVRHTGPAGPDRSGSFVVTSGVSLTAAGVPGRRHERGHTLTARLRRPAGAPPPPPLAPRAASGLLDVHLRAAPDSSPEAVARYADVLSARAPLTDGTARQTVHELFRRYPGCLVAAVPRSRCGGLVGLRGGEVVDARPCSAPVPVHAWLEVLASFLHAWLVAGGASWTLASVSLRGPRDPVELHLTRC